MLLVQANAEGLSDSNRSSGLYMAVHDAGSGFDIVVATRAQVVWIRKEFYSPMGAWFRMALDTLAQRDTEVPMCLSHPPPLRYGGWILFFRLNLRLVPWLNDVIHWSRHDFWDLFLSASRDVKGFRLWRTYKIVGVSIKEQSEMWCDDAPAASARVIEWVKFLCI